MTIHHQAVIHPRAALGKDVSVGPFTCIGPGVQIGDRTRIGPSVVIEAGTIVGENCRIFHGASLGGMPQILEFKDVPSQVHLGDGAVIREYVTVHRSGTENGATRVGRRCLLMAYAHVAHDCDIGDDVVIVNSTGLSGHVVIETQAFVSGMVGIHQFVRIGRNAMVGGGMVIRQDVPPYSLVKGPPPRLVSINAIGLRRRDYPQPVRNALKQAFKCLLRPELNTSQALEKIEAEIEMGDEIRYLINFIRNSTRGITK